jgi:hypothetical protein
MRKVNTNPFNFGRPVKGKDFYNRKEEIETAFGFLKSLHSFSIVGERKIGKTSFLLHVFSKETLEEYGIDPEEYVIIHLNIASLHELTKQLLIKTIVEKIAEEAQIKMGSRNILDDIDVFDRFKAYVEKLASNNRYLVIAFDEFETITPILDDHFSHWLRYIFQRSNVAAITASHKTVQELKELGGSVSPLFNIFGNLFLGLFTREETENMVREMFKRGKMKIQEREICSLVDLSGGNPYLVQLLGFYYYKERKANGGIDDEFKKRISYQARDQFEGYWKHLNDGEREFLFRSETSSNDRVAYVLERKGFLIKEEGEWKIFSPLFKEFVLEKAEGAKVSWIRRFANFFKPLLKRIVVLAFFVSILLVCYLQRWLTLIGFIGSFLASLAVFLLPFLFPWLRKYTLGS